MLKPFLIETRPGSWVQSIEGNKILFTSNKLEACIIRGAAKASAAYLKLKKIFPDTVKMTPV